MSALLKPSPRRKRTQRTLRKRLSREIAQQEDALAGMKRAYSNAVLQYGKGSSEAKELEGHISQLSGELREKPGADEGRRGCGGGSGRFAGGCPPKGRTN